MMRQACPLGALAVGIAVAACQHQTTPFETAKFEAWRAQSKGDHGAAARHWARAEGVADEHRDRREATYRRARELWRDGDHTAAEKLLRSLASQGSAHRGARAAFDLAELAEDMGNDARARQLREAAMKAHPGSGVARGALLRQLAAVARAEGDPAVVPYLQRLARRSAGTPLEEDARYRLARRLEDGGELERALDAFQDVARRFPYPAGAFWDDALLRAGGIARRLGRPKLAVALYRDLVREQEFTTFPGSYQRGRMAEGRLALARCLAEDLKDVAGAVEMLDALVEHNPRSRLVDDALWEAAGLLWRTGQRASACERLTRLARDHAPSRYATCRDPLCAPTPAPAAHRRCEAQLQPAAPSRPKRP